MLKNFLENSVYSKNKKFSWCEQYRSAKLFARN